ncbi:MAG: hypothetical protein AAB876_02775 [Patescibacteria group bacterium]
MFKKTISFFLVLFFSSFIFSSIYKVSAATLTCSDSLNGKAILSEFSSATTAEWVELLNIDESNSINLSNCALKDSSNNVIKSLSGTLPKRGFLTFSLDAGSLGDSAGLIRLTDANGTSLSAVSYGTDTSVTTLTAPTSSQTGYYNVAGSSWATGSSTKGWCNPGTTGCPTIATIVSSMSANGVKTNLADQTDFSRITGLYFQKSETNDPDGTPIGKITFLSEMNFTDQDALSWMQNMGTNIDMSTKGTIGLNADLIKNLTATNASLTMYGLSLSNPEVLVDGATDTGGVVSGLSYSGGSLTFTAAHFTTFKAQERSTSSGTSSPTTPTCSKEAPNHSPDLFQIDTTKNGAKLFFSPVNNAVDQYYIAYGFTQGDERFGVKFDKGYYDGVIDYTINELAPNTNYYFKVRAGNGCATGAWSNWLAAKTDGGFTQTAVNNSSATKLVGTIDKDNTKVKKEVIEPTKSVETPTLGVSDYVPPSQQASQLAVKKSWWQRLTEFFGSLFK